MSGAERARYVLACLLLIQPVSAHAQLSGSARIASDDRWRGRTLSAGRPIASATIGYDAPGGLYLDGSATLAWTSGDMVALTGGAVDAGYAWRTARGLAFDIGAMRQQFTRNASGGRETGYTEIYAGLNGKSLSARLSYSPDYFRANSHTLYLGIDGVIRPAPNWRLTAHAGAIAYLSPIRVTGLSTIEYDYGVGVRRQIGPVELQLDLSSGGPDRDYYGSTAHSKTALVAGLGVTF